MVAPRVLARRALALAGGSVAALTAKSLLSSSSAAPPPGDGAAFTFGVIADVQWADLPVGSNYAGTTKRHYREALGVLGRAVDWWRALAAPPAFIAQLGDLIDGSNAARGASSAALDAALAHLRRAPCRSVHLIGNHELYNFDRPTLASLLGTAPPPERREFYSFAPAAGWRVLVLDAYQEAVIGREAADPLRRRAQRVLARHNANDVTQPGDWFRGLAGLARRYVPFNGALGREQLRWLRLELAAAAAAGERVLVLSHVVLHPAACDGTTMAWDYDEALAALADSGVVAAVLCGHDHDGGYHLDERGTHHLTLCSPLNAGLAGHAYGLVEAHEDRLVLRGPRLADLLPAASGAQMSLPLRARARAAR